MSARTQAVWCQQGRVRQALGHRHTHTRHAHQLERIEIVPNDEEEEPRPETAADKAADQPPGDSDSNNFDDNSVIRDIDWTGEKLDQSTIPPSPSLIFQEGGKKVSIVVGTEVVDAPNVKFTNLRKNRWYKMDKDDAQNYVTPLTGEN